MFGSEQRSGDRRTSDAQIGRSIATFATVYETRLYNFLFDIPSSPFLTSSYVYTRESLRDVLRTISFS